MQIVAYCINHSVPCNFHLLYFVTLSIPKELFLFLSLLESIDRIYHNLVNQLPIDGHIGCYQPFIVTNKAKMNK